MRLRTLQIREAEMVNKDLVAPCGLYCGVCGIRIAHRENNEKFKGKLAAFYGVQAEDIACEGCKSTERFMYCRTCQIRTCAEEKYYEGCYQCPDFPCDHIESFPVPVGKKVILRAVPAWRELGTEKWVEAEEKRYMCPHCGGNLFRGAKRCGSCKEVVDQD
jgi:hypothetical protein